MTATQPLGVDATAADLTAQFGRSPREMVSGLISWLGAMWDLMDGNPTPSWFDSSEWETAVIWLDALAPLLDQRGFLGTPTIDPKADPVGYFKEWDHYLLRVGNHVFDGEPLSVEMAMSAMSVKH